MPADDSAESASGDQGQREAAEEAGLANTDRLVALSDGVVAIALTLLILGISVPAAKSLHNPNSMAELARALGGTLDSWVSYVVSFYVIAQFWMIHHQVFRGIRRHHEGLAAWNFAFLFTISVMPFTSHLIGDFAANPLAIIIFSANLILANLSTHAMLTFGRRHDLLNQYGEVLMIWFRSLQGRLDIAFYLLAIPVAFVSPGLAKVCWFGLAVSPRLAKLLSRGRSPDPPPPT